MKTKITLDPMGIVTLKYTDQKGREFKDRFRCPGGGGFIRFINRPGRPVAFKGFACGGRHPLYANRPEEALKVIRREWQMTKRAMNQAGTDTNVDLILTREKFT